MKDTAGRMGTVNTFGTEYNGKTLWIGCEAALVTITVILCYICSCLGRFAWLVSRGINRQYCTHEGFQIDSRSESRRKRAKFAETCRSKYKRFMVYLCLFAAIATLTKFLLDQFKFFYAWNARSDWFCELIYDITDNFFFGIAFLSVYGFLWMKQWTFYRDPAVVGILYTRKLVVFSRVFIVVMVTLSAGNLITNAIPTRHKAGNSTAPYGNLSALADDHKYLGCVTTYDMTDPSDSWPLLWYAALAATFQVTLLGLFIYPLVRRKIDARKWGKSDKYPAKLGKKMTTKEQLKKGFHSLEKDVPSNGKVEFSQNNTNSFTSKKSTKYSLDSGISTNEIAEEKRGEVPKNVSGEGAENSDSTENSLFIDGNGNETLEQRNAAPKKSATESYYADNALSGDGNVAPYQENGTPKKGAKESIYADNSLSSNEHVAVDQENVTLKKSHFAEDGLSNGGNVGKMAPSHPSKNGCGSPITKEAEKVIKRAVTWTIICVVTDATLVIVFAFIGTGTPLILVTLAEDINLFLNIICLIATYGTWQQILFPLCAGDDVIGGRRASSSCRRKSNTESMDMV